MMEKKNDEPRKIDRWDPDDLDFADTWTRKLLYSTPYEVDRMLKRLRSRTKPGLTSLEFILREFENEAKKKLGKKGLDSEELEGLTELWRTFFDSEDWGPQNPIRRTLDDHYRSLTSEYETGIELQSALHVPFCANKVREDISKGDSQQAAIDMLKLCFATVSASIREIIIRGIRAKRAPFKVRGTDRIPKGIVSAVKYGLKNSRKKDGRSIWRFLRDYCHGDDRNFNGFDIIFEQEENKIYQYDRQGISKSIGFRAFQRHLSEIKKSQ